MTTRPIPDPVWLCPICLARKIVSRMWYDEDTGALYCDDEARRTGNGQMHFVTGNYLNQMGFPTPPVMEE